MTTTEIRGWLLLASVLMMLGALVCLLLSVRRRRRRGLPWIPGIERDLTVWGNPNPKLVKEAARTVRAGKPSRNPDVGELVCRLARRELSASLMPWVQAMWTLLILAQIVNMAQSVFALSQGLSLLLSLSGLAVLFIGFLVGSVLYFRRAREHAERALELNEKLTDQSHGGEGR